MFWWWWWWRTTTVNTKSINTQPNLFEFSSHFRFFSLSFCVCDPTCHHQHRQHTANQFCTYPKTYGHTEIVYLLLLLMLSPPYRNTNYAAEIKWKFSPWDILFVFVCVFVSNFKLIHIQVAKCEIKKKYWKSEIKELYNPQIRFQPLFVLKH